MPATSTASVAPPPAPTAPTPTPLLSSDLVYLGIALAVLVAFAGSGLVGAGRKKFADAGGLLGTALGCDVCSAWWATLVVTLGWWYAIGHPLTAAAGLFFLTLWQAAAGLAVVLLKAGKALEAASADTTVVPEQKD